MIEVIATYATSTPAPAPTPHPLARLRGVPGLRLLVGGEPAPEHEYALWDDALLPAAPGQPGAELMPTLLRRLLEMSDLQGLFRVSLRECNFTTQALWRMTVDVEAAPTPYGPVTCGRLEPQAGEARPLPPPPPGLPPTDVTDTCLQSTAWLVVVMRSPGLRGLLEEKVVKATEGLPRAEAQRALNEAARCMVDIFKATADARKVWHGVCTSLAASRTAQVAQGVEVTTVECTQREGRGARVPAAIQLALTPLRDEAEVAAAFPGGGSPRVVAPGLQARLRAEFPTVPFRFIDVRRLSLPPFETAFPYMDFDDVAPSVRIVAAHGGPPPPPAPGLEGGEGQRTKARLMWLAHRVALLKGGIDIDDGVDLGELAKAMNV